MKTLLTSIIMLSTMTTLAASPDFDTLDRVLKSRYDDPGAPGAAIIIARGDSIIYERYTGIADLVTGEKIGPETRLNIASISKQFTVMALLQQAAIHNPALLDQPVSKFFNYPQSWWHDITLRHLASHTSGVPDTRPRDNRQWCVMADDEQSIAYFHTVEAPQFAPGTYYDYLNPSFILLAKVVEQLSGEQFTSYVDNHVFAPAEMYDTYYFDRTATPPHQAHAYVPDGDGWKEYDFGEETFFATRPDGGIYATARDMLRWENALFGGKIVSAEALRQACTPIVSVTDSPLCDYQRRPYTWYGLGLFIEKPEGAPLKIYHTGDNGGFQAYVASYPESDTRIIVLENRADRSRDDLVQVIDNVLGMR
jgi:CubicO group peptidase (beta-lactamase class C family)